MGFPNGFRKQAVLLAGVCAIALVIVAGVTYKNMLRLSQLLTQNTEISAVLRNHQFADMMHDTMRAQVYRSLWEGRDHPDAMVKIQTETEDYITQFQAAIEANAKRKLDPATSSAIEQAKTPLKQYIQKTRTVLAAVPSGPSAAQAPFLDFQTTFETLEDKMAAITDLLQERVEANEAAGQKAKSRALLEISLTLFLAIVFVFWVLQRAGWRLANTLQTLSSRLRHSQISEALSAPDNNEISILIEAFNAHNLQLREKEERWKLALEGAGDAAWDGDATTKSLEFSSRWWRMLGYDEGEKLVRISNSDWLDGLHPHDRDNVIDQLDACRKGATDSYYAEYRYRCKDASWKWIHARGMVLSRGPKGEWLRMLGTCADVSERKALEARIHALAYFDVLTGLANRSLFSDRVQQAIVVAQRESTKIALMFVDLDKFKAVNDRLGHGVGDLLLVQVAQRLKQCIRESDTAGRVGGDEFVVLLRPVQTHLGAIQVAEKILHALRQPFNLDGNVINISSSIGIALYPEHGEEENALIKSADDAMYIAKNKGRDNVQVATERDPV